MLGEVGIRLAPDVLAKVVRKVGELGRNSAFALYDDVIPTLKSLKERKLITGLLTNLDRDMRTICTGLGVGGLIDFITTSGEVGSDKPNPPIFMAALRKAKVAAHETVHVGDQYGMDIIGARGVGINPVLLDRFNLSPDVTDCPRIRSLTELARYLP